MCRFYGKEKAGGVFLMVRSKKPRPASSTPARTESVEFWITHQANMDLLRFITCGSVDDGKSTLIGRLLWETLQILEI
jgi:bifunctional enzyme CysN/CysC